MPKKSIKLAVKRAGGAPSLAAFLKVSHQAVYGWISRGWFPPARAIQIEKKYKVPRADLVKPELAKLLAA